MATRRDSDEADAQDAVPDSEAPERLTAAEAARAGIQQVVDIISKRPEGVTSVAESDGGWVVEIEVLEDRHVPSSSDVLGLYEVELDERGELRSYRRTQRYTRGRGDGGDG